MIMWNSRRLKRQAQADAAGFTLLEVLVAVAIVAIALVTFMGLHLRSLEATIRAQDLTTAVLLAQAKMATMGEFPDTGEEQGKFEGPELERFQWATRSEEHTSELQSHSDLVCRLLLEKKKKIIISLNRDLQQQCSRRR